MKNNCPVCQEQMQEAENYYCEECGCNIYKQPKEEKQNAASDGENQNFKDVIL